MNGIKTNYFTDVKIPVFAGMPFGNANNKIKKIGFDIFRLYYDSEVKDCQVGSERLKRVLR